MDPDPHLALSLDPEQDPHKMDADPKHCWWDYPFFKDLDNLFDDVEKQWDEEEKKERKQLKDGHGDETPHVDR
jgi:hypothetical protein